jgi:quinol monooxygenase YgiN
MLVRAGCEEQFERVWRAAAERIARYPGNLGQSLSYDHAQPRRFVIASDWTSRETLGAFEGSPERVALSSALDPLRESASKSVLEVVAVVECSLAREEALK